MLEPLLPKLGEMARTHQTLFAMHASRAREYKIRGMPDAVIAEEVANAQREHGYYNTLVTLKRLIETSHNVLDTSGTIATWNTEAQALLAAMPERERQSLEAQALASAQ